MDPSIAARMVYASFVDDGQPFAHPLLVDTILKAIDRRLEQAGAIRGRKSTHGTVNSMFRVFVSLGEESTIMGWDTEYSRNTCNILGKEDPCTILGGVICASAH